MWIFFRAKTLSDAFIILYKIIFETPKNVVTSLSLSGALDIVSKLGTTASNFIAAVISVIVFIIFEILVDRKDNPIEFFENKYSVVRWCKYVTIIFLVLIFGVTGQAGEFIYGNF